METSNNVVENGAVTSFFDSLISWCLNTGLKVVIAFVILFISFRIITVLSRRIQKKFSDDRFDKTLVRTLTYIGNVGLKILVALCLVSYVGIDTSGIAALVTSLGVCLGLAVNGALSNLAGGVLIIFTRPFKVDDYIEVEKNGISGTVEDIHIVYTKLRTPDNKVVYIPNGTLSNSSIINYSEKDTRRVDFTFTIAYESDFNTARDLILDIISSHELTLDDPAPMVRMSAHGDSGVDITARVWVKSDDYWNVNWDILEAAKKAFDESNIEIPYNKLDVNVKNV